jgi:hypothetical protein
MKRGTTAIAAAALSITACNQTGDRRAASNAEAPATVAPSQVSPTVPPPATVPDSRTPLAEPRGPIDPKSAEAAGQIVQHYGALIEQRRWPEAEKLWGDAASAAQFSLQLERYPETHLAIGNLGDMEGAAGSIYVTEPVTFYGKDQNDVEFRRSAEVILRRVNDVPGSTEAQRRWHIERIEWKDAVKGP